MRSYRLPDVLIKARGVVGLVVSLAIALMCALGAARACALTRVEQGGRSPMEFPGTER